MMKVWSMQTTSISLLVSPTASPSAFWKQTQNREHVHSTAGYKENCKETNQLNMLGI
jgi:hypothetical protein